MAFIMASRVSQLVDTLRVNVISDEKRTLTGILHDTGYIEVGYSPLYIYYELLVIILLCRCLLYICDVNFDQFTYFITS